METNNILFVVIILAIAIVVVGMVVNENYCNCLPTGVQYGTTGGYMRNFGWPVGMPYDSFARQMMATSDLNVCAPNVFAANKMTCPSSPSSVQVRENMDQCEGSPDYGSVLSMRTTSVPLSSTSTVSPRVMVQSPEVSYKYTYTAERGPGRFGWGMDKGGMTSYGAGPSGCGFKLFSAPPMSSQGPAGSFTTRPVQVAGECSDSQGYNMGTGVM